ncbi:ATP-binding cassette domain-containing protein [Candidatus Bathyarchaeota archaeon]|nr:ATP-binding cassette domain-containing protein [Candidatus Bathyarchaeota archaeon]
MLHIENLTVSVGNGGSRKAILKDLNLHISEGEVHVLFGPNGSGKSTLVSAILGLPGYNVERGTIKFKGQDITGMSIDERVNMGIGVVFQYPPAIRGIKLNDIANLALKRKSHEVATETRSLASRLNVDQFLQRDVNLGFSGGEKKRSEVMQIMLQDPDFLLLDEPDSGVDVENVQLLGNELSEFLQREEIPNKRRKAGLIITHLGFMLNYIDTDRAHVMCEGNLLCSGKPKEILDAILENGFDKCVKTCLVNTQEQEVEQS